MTTDSSYVYEIREEDAMENIKLHRSKDIFAKLFMTMLFLTVLVISFAIVSGFIVQGVGALAVSLPLPLALVIIIKNMRHRRDIKNLYRQPGLLGKQHLTLNDKGMRIKNDGMDFFVYWDQVINVLGNEEYYYILMRTQSFIMIPKRDLDDSVNLLEEVKYYKEGE